MGNHLTIEIWNNLNKWLYTLYPDEIVWSGIPYYIKNELRLNYIDSKYKPLWIRYYLIFKLYLDWNPFWIQLFPFGLKY
jgi:hypothetical protein